MPRKVFAIPVLIVLALYPFSTPFTFPSGRLIEIPLGHSVSDIGRDLRDYGVIKSVFAFKLVTELLNATSNLKAGRYVFNEPFPVWEIVSRLTNGKFDTERFKVTIPEGFTNKQIAELFKRDIGEENQGYLFPDTYYFDEFATVDEIQTVMIDNFKTKIGEVNHTDVILASILEKEVRGKEDTGIVAGILKKRLDLGMLLQVDAVPITYEEIGLPAAPICNPGLAALNAARNPTESPYIYYLSDKDGVTHYAETFEEHRLNKVRYLR
ncbi:MAG TPA: endolytic transglycosylase MltG [Candidatus Paceibacterota bacterium]